MHLVWHLDYMHMTALMRKLIGISLMAIGAASLMMMFVFPTRSVWLQMAGVFLILLGVSQLCYPIFRKRPSAMDRNQPPKSGELTGQTPATLAMAACFIFFVFYFILETYFVANEYYAHGAPYFALACGAIVVGFLASYLLKRIEPDRVDANLYGLLLGLGAALALYSLLPRLNAATDTDGIESYEYVLGPDYIWHSSAENAPDLDVYLEMSEWWQQYEPGDHRAFDLRKGGLGFWQINMSRIYTEQQAYYDCAGVVSCITR